MYIYIYDLCIFFMLKYNMVMVLIFLSLTELELKENMHILKDCIKYQYVSSR